MGIRWRRGDSAAPGGPDRDEGRRCPETEEDSDEYALYKVPGGFVRAEAGDVDFRRRPMTARRCALHHDGLHRRRDGALAGPTRWSSIWPDWPPAEVASDPHEPRHGRIVAHRHRRHRRRELTVAGVIRGGQRRRRSSAPPTTVSVAGEPGARSGRPYSCRKARRPPPMAKLRGPVYMVRQAKLGEVSFVALGADDATTAKVEAGRIPVIEGNNKMEVMTMDFEKWVEAKGFVLADLSEDQTANLKAMYEAEANPDGKPDGDEPPQAGKPAMPSRPRPRPSSRRGRRRRPPSAPNGIACLRSRRSAAGSSRASSVTQSGSGGPSRTRHRRC